MQNNSDGKTAKYSSLTNELYLVNYIILTILINILSLSYSKVVFVNLSMGAIGLFLQFSFILNATITLLSVTT